MFTLRSRALPLLVTLASTALLGACKSATHQSGAATGKTIQQAADEIDLTIGALDATVASLNEILNNPAPALSKQLDSFTSNLKSLESRATEVRDLATAIDANSQAYFAKWDEQIATIVNEDIRERSQDRRADLDESFKDLREQYGEARDEFKPLLADLKDVHAALAADLTPSGIEVVRKTAKKCSKSAEDVKESLSELAQEFRSLGVGLGQAETLKTTPAGS